MSAQGHRHQDQADRERLIVATARQLAERHGWHAVTTRVLADHIGYSQPVLYAHFRSKRAIIAAVALDGATEMAAALRAATSTTDTPRTRVTALARTYLDFAARNPAVYDALLHLDAGLTFADQDTPQPLKDTFTALSDSLDQIAGDGVHPGLFTEVFWAALHGLATLARTRRLPPEYAEHRLELLVDRLTTV